MKRKIRLKPFVVPFIYLVFTVALLITVLLSKEEYKELKDDNVYVSSSILDTYIPVVTLESSIVKPFNNNSVEIGINYYNLNDPEETQEKSIVYYKDTYMPNTGIDYTLEDNFDVIAIMDGEVIEISDEELLGKTVTVRHNNDLISIYQGLSEVTVEKNENISIGDVIGKSGKSELNSNLGNHLHFELIFRGQNVDPEDYYGKKISELN